MVATVLTLIGPSPPKLGTTLVRATGPTEPGRGTQVRAVRAAFTVSTLQTLPPIVVRTELVSAGSKAKVAWAGVAGRVTVMVSPKFGTAGAITAAMAGGGTRTGMVMLFPPPVTVKLEAPTTSPVTM